MSGFRVAAEPLILAGRTEFFLGDFHQWSQCDQAEAEAIDAPEWMPAGSMRAGEGPFRVVQRAFARGW